MTVLRMQFKPKSKVIAITPVETDHDQNEVFVKTKRNFCFTFDISPMAYCSFFIYSKNKGIVNKNC